MTDRTVAAHTIQDWIEISDWARLAQKPVVSVLMLAYNHAPYLAEAIDGVLMQQAGFPIELLIGEDRSKDNTLEIALGYQREHPELVRVITADRNVGMHENFRRLALACRGDCVAFCEGDDYWVASDKLARQASLLEADTQLGAVHTDFNHLFSLGGQPLLKKAARHSAGVVVPQGLILDELYQNFFITTCTLMVRRSLLLHHIQGKLCRNDFFGGDWPLVADVAARSKIAYIDEPMSVYRTIKDSAMNQGYVAALARLRKIWFEQSEIARLLPISEAAVTAWQRKYSIALAGYAFRARDAVALDEAIHMQARLGAGRSRLLPNLVMSLAMKTKPLHELVLATLNMRERVVRHLRYKVNA